MAQSPFPTEDIPAIQELVLKARELHIKSEAEYLKLIHSKGDRQNSWLALNESLLSFLQTTTVVRQTPHFLELLRLRLEHQENGPVYEELHREDRAPQKFSAEATGRDPLLEQMLMDFVAAEMPAKEKARCGLYRNALHLLSGLSGERIPLGFRPRESVLFLYSVYFRYFQFPPCTEKMETMGYYLPYDLPTPKDFVVYGPFQQIDATGFQAFLPAFSGRILYRYEAYGHPWHNPVQNYFQWTEDNGKRISGTLTSEEILKSWGKRLPRTLWNLP